MQSKNKENGTIGFCFVLFVLIIKEVGLATTKRKLRESKVVPDLGTMKDGREQRFDVIRNYQLPQA